MGEALDRLLRLSTVKAHERQTAHGLQLVKQYTTKVNKGYDAASLERAGFPGATKAEVPPLKSPKLAPLSDEQYAAHTRHVEEKIGAALKAGHSTDSEHAIDVEKGLWKPERAKVHRQIVDELYAKHAHVPNEGKAIIAGGLGGAGKTTVLTKHAGIDTSKYLNVNPDDIKEEMARRGMVPHVEGLSPMEAAPLVHEESSHIAGLLAKRAYSEKKNVMWDITMGSHRSTKSRIDALHTAGYGHVHGVFVDIPVETSVHRALSRHREGLERYRQGTGLGGRYVPPEIIRKNASDVTSSANRETFDALSSHFDRHSLYDNSVEGRSPYLVEDVHHVRSHVTTMGDAA